MECVHTLFAHKRKSVESLGLGWVTVSPEQTPHILPDGLALSVWRMLVNVTLRLMGERRRIAEVLPPYPIKAFPGTVRQYIQQRTKKRQQTDEWLEWLREHLLRWGVMTTDYLLRPENLWFQPARDGDPVWVCQRCQTKHLHDALGQCTNCLAVLPQQPARLDRRMGQEEDYLTSCKFSEIM
jgi:hypothetical protein